MVVRVESGPGVALGYVWGEWLAVGVMAFHACSLEGERLPIFTTDFLDQLLVMAFWIGADEVVTALDGHPRPKPIERLLKSLGFDKLHDAYGTDTCFTINTRTYHGLNPQLGHQDCHEERPHE